jgi:vanillate/3-O-methylgallate O-demethylase
MSNATEAVRTLTEALENAPSPVDHLRSNRIGPYVFPVVDPEYSNWRDEQLAWREASALLNQSHHMFDLYIEGPDAVDMLADLGINDFSEFDVDDARQFVACNPDGYVIGDAILFFLDEDRLNLVGAPIAPDWVQYNAVTGEYDVSVEMEPPSQFRDGPPSVFRYQIQGPKALPLMEDATDEELPDVPFFRIGEFTIAGHTVRGLRHGMTGQPGFELFGPWEHKEEVKGAIVAAGEAHDLHLVGSRAYPTSAFDKGWVPFPLPAIYDHEELAGFREWLTVEHIETIASLGGSFESDDVTDYYMTPYELDYGRLIDFEHEFVGRDALRDMDPYGQRTKVSLVWNDEDVADVLGSTVTDEVPGKDMDFPNLWYFSFQYDQVLGDGDPIGVSKYCTYSRNIRSVASLAVVDPEYADPGTDVSLLWGLGDGGATRPHAEEHAQTELGATVHPAPYFSDKT